MRQCNLYQKWYTKKKDANGNDSIVMDAGVNILPTAYWYDFEPKLANKLNGSNNNLNGKNQKKW